MKKLIVILLFLLLTVCVFVGCGKNENGKVETYVKESLDISDKNLQLVLGDVSTLSANYIEIDGYVLSYVSSDPSIVQVDDTGKIQALSIGSATITVKYGENTKTCDVEVTDGNKVPTLEFEDFAGSDVTLVKGETFNFSTNISFNDKVFTNGEITYSLSNSLGQIDKSGIFTAGSQEGDCVLTISGAWKGLTIHDVCVNIHIIASQSVVINDGRITEFNLYTISSFAGNDYLNSQVIDSVAIEEDGKAIGSYSLSIEDSSIASLTEEEGKKVVNALKSGSTTLRILYNVGQTEKVYTYAINVQKPIVEYSNVVENFSILDGTFYDSSLDKMSSVESVLDSFIPTDVLYDDKVLTYQDGKILGLPTTSNKVETYSLVLQNDKAGYIVNVQAYAKIIDELGDFVDIMGGTKSQIISGYYMLAKDLIDEDTTLYLPKGYAANSFGGVFDGNGHVITCGFSHVNENNEELVRYGLFGFELRGTIKNVAFSNIKTNGTSSKLSAGFLCVQAADGSLVQDVYLDISFTTPKAVNIALMYSMNWSVTLKNVVVVAENIPTTYEFNSVQTNCSEYGTLGRGTVKAGSNIYVVSTAPVYHNEQGQSWNISGLTTFDTLDTFNTSSVDCANFNSEVWDLTTGHPIWKALNK